MRRVAAAPSDPTTSAPRLRVCGVTVRFGDFTALDDVSLEVAPGEIVGLIGPNGAGKTTLVDVICGATEPTGGTVEIDGLPIDPDPHQLAARGIARTQQGLSKVGDQKVLHHVLAGMVDPPRNGLGWVKQKLFRTEGSGDWLRDRAQSLLRDAKLADLADVATFELGTEERRRLAVVRALIANPRLLLLDEPGGGLAGDQLTLLGQLIRATPRRSADRPAVLHIEHHVDLVLGVSDRVIVLDRGRIIASGTPAEIRASDAARAAYLDAG